MILFFLCNFLLTIHFIRPGLFFGLIYMGLRNGRLMGLYVQLFQNCYHFIKRIMAHPIFEFWNLYRVQIPVLPHFVNLTYSPLNAALLPSQTYREGRDLTRQRAAFADQRYLNKTIKIHMYENTMVTKSHLRCTDRRTT